MIDLKKLIQIAPFPEDTKADLATKIRAFNDSQKRDLELLSWDLIRESYEDRVAFDTEIAMTEVALGQKKASEVDLEKIEENIFNELVSRFESSQNESQIDEIREKLQAQTPNSN